MKPESPTTHKATDQLSLVSSDFEPMYELSEADYQAVIHQLTGLLADTVERLRNDAQIDRAITLASQAHDILLSYDDDMAELVRFAARAKDDTHELGQAREENLW